jgi:hypothetical protein
MKNIKVIRNVRQPRTDRSDMFSISFTLIEYCQANHLSLMLILIQIMHIIKPYVIIMYTALINWYLTSIR